MKAKPLTDATVNIYITVSGFIFKKSLFMFSLLKNIEIMTTIMDIIRAPMAIGVALKT